MRVAERHTDLGPAVLEAEHLLHLREFGEFGGAVGPYVEDETGLVLGEAGEGRVVVGGEADDFAAPKVPGEGGEAVLEDDHVVGAVGNLAELAGGGVGGAEGAFAGRRVVGAALAVRGDGDRVTEQRVVADRGGGGDRFEGPQVHGVAYGVVAGVVVDQLPAVGERRHRLLHRSLFLRPHASPHLNRIKHN